MSNQLYHDLQSTFIDALFCCVKLSRTLKKPLGKLIGVTEVEVDISIAEDEGCDVSNVEESADSESVVPFADLIGGEKCPTIDVDGKNIYKATVVNQFFSRNKLSKDRLRRVQGLTSGTPGECNNANDDNHIFIGDHQNQPWKSKQKVNGCR